GEAVRERFAHMTTLVSQRDNGPENPRRRTPCRQRRVDFVQPSHVPVRLGDYPPSHRKYKPIERWWGLRENHGNGTVRDSIDPVLQFPKTMPGQGKHAIVALVTAAQETGVTLTKDAMQRVEAQRKRLPVLGKWFVDIVPPA